MGCMVFLSKHWLKPDLSGPLRPLHHVNPLDCILPCALHFRHSFASVEVWDKAVIPSLWYSVIILQLFITVAPWLALGLGLEHMWCWQPGF